MAEFLVMELLKLVHRVSTCIYRHAGGIFRLSGEIESIQLKLETLRRSLRAADRVKHRDSGIAEWVDRVRNESQELEDVVDEYFYSVRKGGGVITKYKLRTKLEELKPTIERTCERTPEAVLHLQDDPSVAWAPEANLEGSSRHRADEFAGADAGEFVEIEEHEKELETWMTIEKPHGTPDYIEPRSMAIAICGMPGVGKTTLASRVFHKDMIKKHFDCREWVCVSETFHVLGLLRSLAKRLRERGSDDTDNPDDLDRRDLVRSIRALLDGKRYLIVFDDVWCDHFWVEIRDVFSGYTPGCRILLTTRSRDAARSFALDGRVLELRPLEENKALILFCKKAFWRDRRHLCPGDLEYWARKIVGKCSGLPLALVVVGSLMSLRGTDPLTWQNSYHALDDEFIIQDSVKSVVLLSFHYLPYHLKMCFLYCSMFPEDYPIGRKLLIRLWVAEGFVEPRDGATLEQVAEGYLRDLIHRNMIEVVERNETGRVRACKLHDVVRKISAEQRQGTLIRSLSIQQQVRQIPHHNPSKLRSLLVFASDDQTTRCIRGPPKLMLLKVLDLRGVPIKKVPSVVFDLYNLNYLSLRDTKVEYEVFPREIGKLRQLQTLDLWRTHVQGLPPQVENLHELRHLMMCDPGDTPRNCALLPNNLKGLVRLQTLKSIRASDHDALKELTELRSLSINEVRNTDGLALCNAIGHMCRLLRLKAKPARGHYLQLHYLSPPPPSLQKLQLHGQLMSVPRWLSSLHNLTHLYLFDSKVRESPVDYVESLKRLVFLCLDNAYDGAALTFRSGCFKSLRILYIREMPFLGSIDIDSGALPDLQKLYIRRCGWLRKVPRVEDLPCLQELYVRGCGKKLEQDLRQICDYLPSVKLHLI